VRKSGSCQFAQTGDLSPHSESPKVQLKGQAHFSAMTFSTKHANSRRKMCLTPACERLQISKL